ncbi:UDP-N-acetylglucosamine--N-acetylmuramyl-(pentapeptide) pyrophosphoryl-undecaprenol N-acetylglucosamine transferase [Actinomyces sp. B33]|uniref:UDP-N-acetylglucosamine--N-acetylmuramyl- (pentapeptide) pyrophosphoryl-undecaprenol N-acetylglucosamine transferase n=1 Tax=Actinomyces sp. B33 TaxID=2942131 RepID=UPI0023401C76|nr:UDP-N-acetylglucosamine--N-acetylmuramyl-(pentapeptide) pyrophosphoryl-undecaprenol N-acetylglucosamine transferase [Actinomyces sp. B33]MDC4233082.1 UDP-N-acetylglucosamine--N-acetylmuramyl-(pentapeptide) pyrophosphoryl-undecaprenol N-acetylglucosamine transferase [Actinomyces sp. B33]
MSARIVMAGGGTAGHVNPLLATAHELVASGCDVTVIGTEEGLEARLVPAAGLDLVTIPRVPLPRRPSAQLLTLVPRWRRAVDRCAEALAGADALVGFGGYVSTPAYRAAARLGVPVVVHEQNARPGLANRVGARRAAVVALTFASTPLAARAGRTQVVGLPLRPAIADLARRREDPDAARGAREEAAARLGIDPSRTTVLVTGGSLGAVRLNEAVAAAARDLPEGAQVVHLTGRGKDAPVREAIAAAGAADRWLVLDYLTTMEDALAVADLVVCRSGAGTVAEMTALGLPCVYVPLPIGNGEQRLNARDHVGAGGAVLVDDDDFTAEAVRTRVWPLVGSDRLVEMARASRDLGGTDAARALADLVIDAAEGRIRR